MQKNWKPQLIINKKIKIIETFVKNYYNAGPSLAMWGARPF